jgi:hypothetical protein
MRKGQTGLTFKLRLLAFVLAVALVWYSLNPAPIIRHKREEEPPDEKRRSVEPQVERTATLQAVLGASGEIAKPLPALDEDMDDLEWPEFLDG